MLTYDTEEKNYFKNNNICKKRGKTPKEETKLSKATCSQIQNEKCKMTKRQVTGY